MQERSGLPNWLDIPLAAVITIIFGSMVTITTWSMSYEPPAAKAPQPALDMQRVAAGHRLYAVSCVACHGADARGVQTLGKNLRMGLAASLSDDALSQLIIRGRNPGEPGHTALTPMPPRGGRDDFTDADVADIVVYLRSLQDPTRVTGTEPEVFVKTLDEEPPVASSDTTSSNPSPTTVAASSTAPGDSATTEVASAEPSAGGFPFDKEAALRGKRVYMNCIACHGKDAAGLKNLGADLLHSDFVRTKSDQELLDFVKKGRLPTDPDSKLHLTMPPKAGNPALKDNQILDVIAYVRSLQAQASGK